MVEYTSLEAAEAAGAKGSDRIREECANCEGGRKPWFSHVLNGVCFQCNGAGSHTVLVSSARARERRHQKLLEEQAAARVEESRKAAARAEWNTENSAAYEMMKGLAEAGVSFAADVLESTRIPSEKQLAVLQRIADERAEKAAAATDVPEGRGTVTGKVISVKETLDNFSHFERYITKILVEDPRGFRVYGTCPESLKDAAHDLFMDWIHAENFYRGDFGPTYYLENFLKGREVSFTATLEGKEKGFGFFKRPTKASFAN